MLSAFYSFTLIAVILQHDEAGFDIDFGAFLRFFKNFLKMVPISVLIYCQAFDSF